MEKKSIGKYVAIAAILLVIIAAIGLSGAYKGLGLSFFGANLLSFTPVSTCGTSITNLQCGNQVAGGVVTGLSQVTYTNDFGSFGSTWILTFVLNGAGQYFFGSSSQQLATAINGSTVANNYNLQLTAVQNSQRLVIPYSFSGQYLYTLKSTPIAFNFGWFSQGAGLLTTCYQTNQSASNPTYTVACAGTYATSDLSNVFNAYQSTCQSNSGKAFLLGSGSLGGINGYQLACYGVSSTSAGQIYAAGSPAISENISVIYQNGTSTHKFYLTAQQPENSYNNEIAAQIYGYTVGGLNTYIGTTSPTLIVTSSSAEFINPQSTATINLLNSLSASCYSSAGLNLAGVAFSNYYNPTVFQNCVNQQNQNISVLLSSPLQPTSPFANIKLLGLVASRQQTPDAYSGSPYEGVVNVTNNPVYNPEIQFLSSAKGWGVVIPVAQPYIISVSQAAYQSGSSVTATYTVGNKANIQASAYIVTRLNNQTVVGQSPNFAIPSQGQATEQVTITGYNNNTANLNAPLTACIYASQNTAQFSCYPYTETIRPNCPAGTVYVNNSNCQDTTHTCTSGYYWDGTSCHLICSPPSIFNATTQSCYVPPPPPPPTCDPTKQICGIQPWEIVAVILVIIAVIIGLSRRKSGRNYSVKRSRGGVR